MHGGGGCWGGGGGGGECHLQGEVLVLAKPVVVLAKPVVVLAKPVVVVGQAGGGVGQAGGGVGQAGGGGGACVRVVCSDWATDGVHNDDCNELDESVGEARPECDEIGACIFWSEFEGAGGRAKELFRAECTGGRAKELCRS